MFVKPLRGAAGDLHHARHFGSLERGMVMNILFTYRSESLRRGSRATREM